MEDDSKLFVRPCKLSHHLCDQRSSTIFLGMPAAIARAMPKAIPSTSPSAGIAGMFTFLGSTPSEDFMVELSVVTFDRYSAFQTEVSDAHE
jgi:hypothetical protein